MSELQKSLSMAADVILPISLDGKKLHEQGARLSIVARGFQLPTLSSTRTLTLTMTGYGADGMLEWRQCEECFWLPAETNESVQFLALMYPAITSAASAT